MLLNISHDFAAKKKTIDDQVGKPYTLAQRKELGRTTFSKIPITAASIEIYNLLTVNQQENSCSIELRPKGIIISFRSNMESYSLIIPNYKLKVYKGKAEEYSFYKDHYFIKVWASAVDPEIHSFVKQIRKNKSDNAPPRVDDMP